MQTIDGYVLKDMMISGVQLLERNREAVDALNVFPVPDGDTGTNMSLTMAAAVKEINGGEYASCSEAALRAAKGALRGARGNSGVILSQIFRGFAAGLDGAMAMTADDFVNAWKNGADTAYKAVMKPKEGTILTVVRSLSDEALRSSQKSDDIVTLMQAMLVAGERTLARTPDMLPALKQAGVVDSGGKGLLILFAGMLACLKGDALEGIKLDFDFGNVEEYKRGISGEGIEFGYCTELIIKANKDLPDNTITALRNTFEQLGDSLVLVYDPPIVKVHVHTNRPGRVLNIGLDLGELLNVKVDNMRDQHAHILSESESLHREMSQKDYGFVAVSLGSGFEALFKDLSVDKIVGGGQTMNPSIDDICHALENINAKTIFVLPNNSNVIMAAQQAAEIVQGDIRVLPSKSVPQGIAGLVAFIPDSDPDENEKTMREALIRTNTAQVTYAVRDSKVEDREIHKGDIIGILNGKIIRAGKDVHDIFLEVLDDIVNDAISVITLFYGQDVDAANAQRLAARIGKKYPDIDIAVHDGGQPLYYFMASIE